MISTSLNSPIANIFVAICTIVITAGITAAGASNGVSFPLGKVKIPVLAVCTVASFVINLIGFFIAYALHTERFYDITGTLTYIVTICLSLGLSLAYHEPTRSNSRGYILFALVLIWTLRLGFYLFRRALRYGDSRFSAAVHDFTEYLKFWMLQALWVILTAVAALSAITSTHDRGAFANAVNIVLAVIGLILWTVGMLIETVADYQKSVFREDPKNSGRFIKSGLWSCSRHPNYFGEVLLWIGVAFFSGPALFEHQYITLISPFYVFLLVRFSNGVPLLEKSADARWGGQSDYEEYKARVPIFFPIKLTCME